MLTACGTTSPGVAADDPHPGGRVQDLGLAYDSRVRLEKDREGAGDTGTWQAERVRTMHASNPKYVLRNYIAHNAIEAAENGDFSEARAHLSQLCPWGPQPGVGWRGAPPKPHLVPPGATSTEAAGDSVPQGRGGPRGPGCC